MKKFFSNMFNGGNDVSSKRVIGTICVLVILIMTILSIILNWEIKAAQENLLSTILWGGIVLLGATGVEKIIKNK